MNYFDLQPNEVLMVIYSFIPEHLPILRKLDRRWRALLADKNYDECECIEAIIHYGYKYWRGALQIADVFTDIERRLYNTLIYAEYMLHCSTDALSDIVIKLYFHIEDIAIRDGKDGEFINSLCVHIASKIRRRNTYLLEDIARINDVDLLMQMYDIGFGYNDCTIIDVRDINMLRALRYIGCPWNLTFLYGIVDEIISMEVNDIEAHYEMFEYAINDDCEIGDQFAEHVVDSEVPRLVDILCAAGYVFPDKLLLRSVDGVTIQERMQEYMA